MLPLLPALSVQRPFCRVQVAACASFCTSLSVQYHCLPPQPHFCRPCGSLPLLLDGTARMLRTRMSVYSGGRRVFRTGSQKAGTHTQRQGRRKEEERKWEGYRVKIGSGHSKGARARCPASTSGGRPGGACQQRWFSGGPRASSLGAQVAPGLCVQRLGAACAGGARQLSASPKRCNCASATLQPRCCCCRHEPPAPAAWTRAAGAAATGAALVPSPAACPAAAPSQTPALCSHSEACTSAAGTLPARRHGVPLQWGWGAPLLPQSCRLQGIAGRARQER